MTSNPIAALIIVGTICTIVGMLAGVAIAYAAMEEYYRGLAEDIREDAEYRCLHTVRENYEKEQRTRELMLRELGEALDVDMVFLPSFGYVTLKQASFTIPEEIIGE